MTMSSPLLTEEIKNPPDPFSLFRRLQKYPYTFFLDSACPGPHKLGRYSFIGSDPLLVFKSKGGSVGLEWSDGRTENFTADPFTCIQDLLDRFRTDPRKDLPNIPGAVGYFSYDMKNFIEDLPDKAKDDMSIPDCILGFYGDTVIYDNLDHRCYAASYDMTGGGSRGARSRMEILKKRISAPALSPKPQPEPRAPRLRSNFSKAAYVRAVEKAKAYISKGDIYQVNLSQRFECDLDIGPLELYGRLRSLSPAPFAAYLDFKDITVLSSSPERFLRKAGDRIETCPIKGTRPRGGDATSDLALAKELASSAKDMAEHVMIVDLERNDLGRVCEYGSVRPTESCLIEKYANVFHMVSTVSGKLKKGTSPIDCLRAAFPGGSITGAPKIRSMEIIDELEKIRRSIYTGALGYITFDGNMDTSIVIRTFLVKGKKAYFQVGGGIVADSDPQAEYEETLHKARGLMEALGVKVCKPEALKV